MDYARFGYFVVSAIAALACIVLLFSAGCLPRRPDDQPSRLAAPPVVAPSNDTIPRVYPHYAARNAVRRLPPVN